MDSPASHESGKDWARNPRNARTFRSQRTSGPGWYPEIECKFERHEFMLEWGSEKKSQWRGYCEGNLEKCDIKPEFLEDFKATEIKIDEINKRNEAVKLAAHLDREASWRWAYADAMMKGMK